MLDLDEWSPHYASLLNLITSFIHQVDFQLGRSAIIFWNVLFYIGNLLKVSQLTYLPTTYPYVRKLHALRHGKGWERKAHHHHHSISICIGSAMSTSSTLSTSPMFRKGILCWVSRPTYLPLCVLCVFSWPLYPLHVCMYVCRYGLPSVHALGTIVPLYVLLKVGYVGR